MKEEDIEMGDGRCKRVGKVGETWVAFFGSFWISIAGGLMLTWWELRYHPNNRQLWMVPFGLILFITPVLVWLSLFVSEMCCPTPSKLQPPPQHVSSSSSSSQYPSLPEESLRNSERRFPIPT